MFPSSHLSCFLLYACAMMMTSQAAISSSHGGGRKVTVANRRTRRTLSFSHPYAAVHHPHKVSVCQSWTVRSSNLQVKSVIYECEYLKNSSAAPLLSGWGNFKYGALVDVKLQWRVPIKTTDLILHHQDLVKVEDSSLVTSSKQLQSLDLSHNEIATLEDFAFQGLVKLTKLDLSFNDLEMFKSCTVSHLPRLHTLLLHNNRLIHITPLRGIKSPTFHLDMSYNFIKAIEPREFTSFSKHQTIVINLRHNHLTLPSPDWLLLNASVINYPSRCPTNNEIQQTNTTPQEVGHQSGDKLPVHLMWSDGNPWCCSCFILHAFIRKLHAIESGNVCWNTGGNCSLLTDDSGSCVRGITLPCSSPSQFNEVNLASGHQIVTAFERNCCETMHDITDDCVAAGHVRIWTNETRQPACWFVHQWKSNNTRDCKLKMSSWKLTEVVVDNRATLIGIFIVISIPVFLTLLPSCDKEQVETEHLLSGAIGVTIAHHKIVTTTTTTVSTPTNTNVSPNPSQLTTTNSDNV